MNAGFTFGSVFSPPNPPVMRHRFSAAEIANMFNVSIDTVYSMVKSGKLESVRVGSQYVITRTHLLRYLDGDEEVLNDLIQSLENDDE